MVIDFTDLALLVGTNPLPNYVVIKYFLKCNKQLQRIWFLCSEKSPVQAKTSELADNIKAVIKDESLNNDIQLKFEHVLLSNVGSAQAIARDLKRGFKPPKNAVFHLNYTGGTKSMAIHTYKYFLEELGKRCTFSYLDGRDFKLKSDEDEYVTKDLRCEVNISLDSLLKLHSCTKDTSKDASQDNSTYVKRVVNKFEEVINLGKLEEFLKWKDETIRKFYYRDKKFIDGKNSFLEHNALCNDEKIYQFKKDFKKKTSDIIFDLLKTIPIEKSILDDSGDLWIPDESVKNKEYRNRVKWAVKDFLDGKWLEVYVYNVILRGICQDTRLKELYEKGQISIADNWRIKKKGSNKDFELDVVLLNGYQVCCISCTTYHRDQGLCKSKGFEVMHRAKQIGGEEAKSILVTCISDAHEDFYEDLKDISGSSSHEFLALGLQDLRADTLWEKIREHIWGG